MNSIVIRRKAPSKLNLRLKVTARRNDGYHELDTVFMPLSSPGDELIINIERNTKPDISMDISGAADLSAGTGNICWQAARAYLNTAEINDTSIHIHLDKHIPIAAGLGGGSSNAATVLIALEEHFNALGADKLAQTALKIGADVPFFLSARPAAARPAAARGVGEELEYFDFDASALPVLVVAPDFPVSARWAYEHLDCKHIAAAPGTDEMIAALKSSDWEKCAALMHNDLAFALYDKFPLLNILKSTLLEAGALNAEISGSGPSMFALFTDKESCLRAEDFISKEFSGTLRIFR
ncbi:MAG: 4-(cytidine 5'-diphospho)-2-C-methyl-D-erythritol kinase [Victivallales bacterium]|nr:4-(cytidine 5'-diphospho)-2-C-methyl-D-erythritol kinase [Victivallales bacterium]